LPGDSDPDQNISFKESRPKALVQMATGSGKNNVVQEIESRLSVADKMEETINQSLLQSEALKQSIFKQAFEGKLVQ
jgi:type I site-specific restriction endonuclease